MTDNPALHHRRSIRLPGYDYASEGSYFITLVTHDRECLFGRIVNDEMVLSPLGEIVRDEWFRTAAIRENVELFDDEFVIMPNHVHGIINITPPACTGTVGIVGAYCNTPLPLHNMPPQTPSFRSPSNTVGAIIRGFKSAATKRINILRDTPGFPLWQRNYFDRIIGSDWMYENIVNYIDANPRNWAMDDEYTS